jgi:dsDNA-binding SOS-regulon protein
MNAKAIVYDLGISLGAISLWLVPVDGIRLIGYSASAIFAGDAYLRGLTLISRERRSEEKTAIAYEAETDFYDQLLGQTTEAKLEIAALEVETRMLERLIPLVQQKNRLEQQLSQVSPVHPEMTDEQKEAAARSAVDSVFSKAGSDCPEITDEEIRQHFPEQMDLTSWKASLKALQNGATVAELIYDVLGCSQTTEDIGKAYFNLLKTKFL